MPGNGTDTGKDTVAGNGLGAEIEEGIKGKAETSSLNRVELMELSGKDLAAMALPYSSKKISTLERMAKADLCDIIMNGREAPKDDAPKSRAARTQSQTEELVDIIIGFLDAIKRARDDEPLNPLAVDIVRKQAVIKVDEKVKSEQLDINTASNVMLFGAGAFLLFDAFYGVSNSPTLLHGMKKKFFGEKKEAKS